ncbi:uncharacterized protein LOC129592432 isoform X2 [Paramacrobiotus metropolitanus]|uniref:uncharacterized protein LOC129592432 isoform X2 n=1 Tax=Paramacrobiotus metropolitanus TaxID=2943436 RepID=UPI002445FA4E|nr:uncharacterized protein LOC129592432 isoform X2 [Paramacrobiotus metropolitanus]
MTTENQPRRLVYAERWFLSARDAPIAPPPPSPGSGAVDCRQILAKHLDPVIVEVDGGKHALGFLCDVDRPVGRVLVDWGSNRPPRWLPCDKVYQHEPLSRSATTAGMPVMAAVRRDSAGPFLFRPGRVVCTGSRCPSGLVYVEAEADREAGDPSTLRRHFVQPVQLRRMWPKSRGEPHLHALSPVSDYGLLGIDPQVVRLDPDLRPGQLDLARLMRACNDYKPEVSIRFAESVQFRAWCRYALQWASALRIAVEDRDVRVVFEYHATHVRFARFPDGVLRELVRASCTTAATATARGGLDFWLRRLPYELQVTVLRSIQDIHSVVNARRVCSAWHDTLTGHRRHVTIDLQRIAGGPEPAPRWAHLIHVLEHSVDQSTLSLTLMDGDLSPALEAVVHRFLSLKSVCLPAIVLRKVTCQHPLTAIYRQQRLHWGRLGNFSVLCRTLHLQKVTMTSLFEPIAGLWCSQEQVRADLDVYLRRVCIDCMRPVDDQVREFLGAVNRSCRALTPAEWEDISLACDELAVGAGHSFRVPLMLKFAGCARRNDHGKPAPTVGLCGTLVSLPGRPDPSAPAQPGCRGCRLPADPGQTPGPGDRGGGRREARPGLPVRRGLAG